MRLPKDRIQTIDRGDYVTPCGRGRIVGIQSRGQRYTKYQVLLDGEKLGQVDKVLEGLSMIEGRL